MAKSNKGTAVVTGASSGIDAGFDQGELVTIPSLSNAADWFAYEGARQRLIPNLLNSAPARYRPAVAA